MMDVHIRFWEDEEYRHVDIYVPEEWVAGLHTVLHQSLDVMCECHDIRCQCRDSSSCTCKPFWFDVRYAEDLNSELGN